VAGGIIHHGWQDRQCKIEAVRVVDLDRCKHRSNSSSQNENSANDLIVSWCTESFGCIQAVARGDAVPKAHLPELDLFLKPRLPSCEVRKSDLHTLTEVVLEIHFAGIRSNYCAHRRQRICRAHRDLYRARSREPELFGLLRRGSLSGVQPIRRRVRSAF